MHLNLHENYYNLCYGQNLVSCYEMIVSKLCLTSWKWIPLEENFHISNENA